jgi:recombination protein RecA
MISKLKLSSAYSADNILSRVAEYIPTGCTALDLAIGGGQARLGIPVGRMTEIFGENSTGKSILGVHIMAMTQAIGGIALFVNTECAMSDEVMANIGVNMDELIQATPDTVEEVYDVINEVLKMRDETCKDKLLTVVWDSVAATTSKEELEKVQEKGLNSRGSIGATARLLSQLGRCLPRQIAHDRVALVFINQVRENIGVMFGEDFTTTGGKAIGFYASLRIQVSKKTVVKDLAEGGSPIGIIVKGHIYKNKLAKPFETVEMPIMFANGIDDAMAMLAKLKVDKYITTSGGWNKIVVNEEEHKFQGAGWPEFYAQHAEQILQQYYGG